MTSMDIREADGAGQLFLCATPIGNLEDITLRVLDTLKQADLIAAEDTRNSIKLLNHFGIKTPMTSYHEYNRVEKAHYIIGLIREGKKVALITDAGTPAISDPGETLVALCYEAGVRVTSLPGAAACITALTLSCLSTRRFCFEGFLPTDKREQRAVLEELTQETRTIILYEAPHHLIKTLKLLMECLGDRRVTICRELTKRYETVLPITFSQALSFYEENEPRGEYVLVIEGVELSKKKEEETARWLEQTIADHMLYYEKQGIDKKEAMKLVARDRGVGKRDIYKQLLTDEDGSCI